MSDSVSAKRACASRSLSSTGSEIRIQPPSASRISTLSRRGTKCCDRALDGVPIVGLDVGRRARGAHGRLADPELERIDRLRHHELDSLEAEPAPDRLGGLVGGKHAERDMGRTGSAGGFGARLEERLRHALTAGLGPHLNGLDVPAPLVGDARLEHPDRSAAVLGEEHGAGGDVRVQLLRVLLPGLGLEPLGLGHLGLELLPERPQGGLVGGGGGTDVHGIRDAVRR